MNDVKAVIDDFNDHQKALAKAPTTIEWQERLLWWFFAFLETEKVEQLTDVDMRVMLKYQIHVAARKNNRGKPYNARTQNMAVSTVRKLFKYLRRKAQVFVDPTSGLELARCSSPMPRTVLSVLEMSVLLNQPDIDTTTGKRDRAIMETLYSTGIRQAELLHLDLNDLKPDDRSIFIRDGKGKRDRVVPCGDVAWLWLDGYLKTARQRYLPAEADQAVFLSKSGARLGKEGLRRMVKRHARKAGLKQNMSPHAFRHSCATHLCDAGCDIRHVQELLGHSSPSTTAFYVAVSIRKLKEVHQRYHPREKPVEKIA